MTHWQKYHAAWSKLEAPLRPNAETLSKIRNLTGPITRPVLLLGVTPELAGAYDQVLAVDKNKAMIDHVWPGDTATKTARHGDWLDLQEPKNHFAAAVGDGSLNALTTLREIRQLLERVTGLLAPGGRFACRLYERPEQPFSEDHLRQMGSRRAGVNFHAFKWQIAMHLAETGGASMPVVLIRERFNELFPDRDKLARDTGWPRDVIDMIDIYRGSPTIYTFPNRREFQDAVPKGVSEIRFAPSGTYDLAECCPMLAFRKN
ncbi:MAG: class I SAM-dependent methyltransferase [Parvibaculaceae bacterium]